MKKFLNSKVSNFIIYILCCMSFLIAYNGLAMRSAIKNKITLKI